MADTQGSGQPIYNSPVYDPSANQRGWNDPPSLAFAQKSSNGPTGRRIDPRKRVAHNFNSNGYPQGTSAGFTGQQPPLATNNTPQYCSPTSRLQSNIMPNPAPQPHMSHSSSYPVLSTAASIQSPAHYMPITTTQSINNQVTYNGTPSYQGSNTNRPPIPHQFQGQSPSPNIGQPLHQFQNSPFIPSQNGHHGISNGSLSPAVVNHHHSQSMPNLPGAAMSQLKPTQNQGPPPTDGYYAKRASSAENSREHSPITTGLVPNLQPTG